MAKVSIEESTLYAIGDAIREKGGTTAGLDPEGEMPAAIRAINTQEDLSPELTTQDDLISQLNTILDSKSAVTYPTLSNPGSAANLEEGYELIDQNGNVVRGTLVQQSGGKAICFGIWASTTTWYAAEEGMTWREWCDSDYNIDGCYIDGSYVITSGGIHLVLDENYNYDIADNVIVDRVRYECERYQ